MTGLLERARSLGSARVAVAAAVGPATLRAAVEARASGLAEPVLVGELRAVREGLEALDVDPSLFEIVAADTPGGAAATAAGLAASGAADLLLKGAVSTADLMRAVLAPASGLRTGDLLSDVFVIEVRKPAPRLVGLTDGGVVPRPTREQKAGILRNAVTVFHALGVTEPRVALIAAIEKVSEAFPSTLDAAALVRRAAEGEFPGCLVEGPMGLDMALSGEAASLKGLVSPVAGRADVLLFPDLESANLSAKAVEYVVPLDPAHVTVGARVPVLIPSRSESAKARLRSVALGMLVAHARRGASGEAR
jgi:phosphotransacetylase